MKNKSVLFPLDTKEYSLLSIFVLFIHITRYRILFEYEKKNVEKINISKFSIKIRLTSLYIFSKPSSCFLIVLASFVLKSESLLSNIESKSSPVVVEVKSPASTPKTEYTILVIVSRNE